MAYIYEAIRRGKDNDGCKDRLVFTSVYYGDESHTPGDHIEYLKTKCSLHPGKWRIYRTVNRRDVAKAKIEFLKTLLDQMVLPDQTTPKRPEALWKSILASPRNAAERLFLVDIDSRDHKLLFEVQDRLGGRDIHIVETPNGFHVIIDPFNPTLLSDLEYVEVKKDALLFIEAFEVPPCA